MYPDADIPMVQLSIDSSKVLRLALGKWGESEALRDEGIMLVASGNVVHNLRTVNGTVMLVHRIRGRRRLMGVWKADLTWQGPVEQHPLVNYLDHEGGALSNPTPEHCVRLYVLGAWDGQEPITIPVDGIEMGSLSMLSVQIG